MSTDTYLTARHWFLADLMSGDVKLAILNSYTHNDSHEFLDDVATVIDSSANLANKSLDGGWFSSDPAVVASATGANVEAVVLYIDTGTASTSRLIAYWTIGADDNPLDIELDGSDLTITPSALGWFTV